MMGSRGQTIAFLKTAFITSNLGKKSGEGSGRQAVGQKRLSRGRKLGMRRPKYLERTRDKIGN